MIKVSMSTAALTACNTKCYAVFAEQNNLSGGIFDEIEKSALPSFQQLMTDAKFTGSAGEKIVFPTVTKNGVVYYIVAGLGVKKGATIDMESYRRAVGAVVKEVATLKADSLAIALPDAALFGSDDQFLAQQTVTIADMAYYHFDEFITDAKRNYPHDLNLTIVLDKQREQAVKAGSERGIAIARGVHFTRHWVDMPPDYATPSGLVEQAKKIADTHGYSITIFNEHEVNHMGMGGLSAVSRGSERDCHLIILEYKTKKAGAPTLGLVGKGITFDSGGLSIKPADYMETMKDDMAGAAAVLGALDALGSLKPEINIVAVLPLAENLPSGKAIKPGDIVTFYNGKTGEILNTDAEGRLILADALSYAVKHHKLDALIDLATLTGACSVALGHFYTALLSQHDQLSQKIEQASKLSGERVWRLPMDDDFKPAIRSENADIKNIGSKKYSAGTITAAFFLQNFVGDVPWVHLDIAGTAFDVPDMSYYRLGATGVGVRLLVELAMNWK